MRYGGAPRLKKSLQSAMIAEYPGLDEQGNPTTRKSAMIVPYLEAHGKHGFDVPHPEDPFDIDLHMINMIGRFFETRGSDLRFDHCMHRDGYDRSRLDVRPTIKDEHGNDVPNPNFGKKDPEAKRVPASSTEDCSFIPEYPEDF